MCGKGRARSRYDGSGFWGRAERLRRGEEMVAAVGAARPGLEKAGRNDEGSDRTEVVEAMSTADSSDEQALEAKAGVARNDCRGRNLTDVLADVRARLEG